MRVVLPGAVGSELTSFYIRVRSNSDDLSNLAAGQTLGRYQFQVRLQEMDEVPGSTIRYADIRYATNGIEVYGQPIHSPLLGEAAEANTAANDAIAGAQALGNILNTDRAALSIAGELTAASDVDFYHFEISYDSVQGAGIVNPYLFLSTIFDVDYSTSSVARTCRWPCLTRTSTWSCRRAVCTGATTRISPKTSRSRSTAPTWTTRRAVPPGRWIRSSVPSRCPRDVLSGGHQQQPDAGRTGISSSSQSGQSADSSRADRFDHADRRGTDRATRAVRIFPIRRRSVCWITVSVVPFTLGDVTLFVSTEPGEQAGTLCRRSRRWIRTPVCWKRRSAIWWTEAGSRPYIGDIAMRYDGELFSFSQSYFNCAAGAMPPSATICRSIPARRPSPTSVTMASRPIDPTTGPVPQRWTTACTSTPSRLPAMTRTICYAVGDRGHADSVAELHVTRETNILYRVRHHIPASGNSMFSPDDDRHGCDDGTLSPRRCRHADRRTRPDHHDRVRHSRPSPRPTRSDRSIRRSASRTARSSSGQTVPSTETFEFDTGPEVTVAINHDHGSRSSATATS